MDFGFFLKEFNKNENKKHFFFDILKI